MTPRTDEPQCKGEPSPTLTDSASDVIQSALEELYNDGLRFRRDVGEIDGNYRERKETT